MKIGIFGRGFVGSAVEFGFSPQTGCDADVKTVIEENAKLNAEELTSRSSIIRDAVASGKVTIAPAYYNLGSGKVDFL